MKSFLQHINEGQSVTKGGAAGGAASGSDGPFGPITPTYPVIKPGYWFDPEDLDGDGEPDRDGIKPLLPYPPFDPNGPIPGFNVSDDGTRYIPTYMPPEVVRDRDGKPLRQSPLPGVKPGFSPPGPPRKPLPGRPFPPWGDAPYDLKPGRPLFGDDPDQIPYPTRRPRKPGDGGMQTPPRDRGANDGGGRR